MTVTNLVVQILKQTIIIPMQLWRMGVVRIAIIVETPKQVTIVVSNLEEKIIASVITIIIVVIHLLQMLTFHRLVEQITVFVIMISMVVWTVERKILMLQQM